MADLKTEAKDFLIRERGFQKVLDHPTFNALVAHGDHRTTLVFLGEIPKSKEEKDEIMDLCYLYNLGLFKVDLKDPEDPTSLEWIVFC